MYHPFSHVRSAVSSPPKPAPVRPRDMTADMLFDMPYKEIADFKRRFPTRYRELSAENDASTVARGGMRFPNAGK